MFEGYFNKGSLSHIAKAIGVETDEIENFADIVSNIYENDDVISTINNHYFAQKILVDLLSYKVENDIVNNIDKFNSFEYIKMVAFKAFSEFAKTLYFDSTKNSLINYNRIDIFNDLNNCYFELLNNVKNYIAENPDLVAFASEDISFQEEKSDIMTVFEYCNDCSYALIDYNEKPINILDYINNNEIELNDINRANYERKKQKIEDVSYMKDFDKYEKIVQIYDKRNKFYNSKIARESEQNL